MRPRNKRAFWVAGSLLVALVVVPTLAWLSLTHEPTFYRNLVLVPGAHRSAKAKHFVSQSIQLRNDIVNEPLWEAIFTDQEVNAWLAEDLVTSFADQLPPQVHEPRVLFEVDKVTLAFELDRGPVRSIIWVVARPRVPQANVLELTFEKIRAGVLPVPADQVLDRVTEHARARGLDVSWKRGNEGLPVVTVRYTPHESREDVKLEQVEILKGEIRLAGRSDRKRGVVFAPTLPTRQVLQSKFPRRNVQPDPSGGKSKARSSAVPTS